MAKPRAKKKRAAPAKTAAPRKASKSARAEKSPSARVVTSGSTRNPELEARLVAQPEDPATREVYADWLQSVGDPLGELLALANAGEERLARLLLAKRESEIVGDVEKGKLVWRRGLIDEVWLQGDANRARKTLAAILERPAGLVVRRLVLGLAPDRAFVDVIERAAALRSVFCWSGRIGEIASPTLELLELFLEKSTPLDFDALAPLLGAGRVPALRRLDFLRHGRNKLPLPFLEVLLDSKLLRQLQWLAFRQEVVTTGGVELLLRRRDALAHLRGVFIHSSEEAVAQQIAGAFGEQYTDQPGTGEHAGTIRRVAAYETWPV